MGLYVQYNSAYTSSLSSLNKTTQLLNKSYERLTTGYKINRASDGAAGLAISEGLRAQIRGATMAQTNIQAGISMLNVADQGVQSSYDALQRMREIAVAASNTGADYTALNAEFQQLVSEINQISTGTEYNNQVLLNGSITTMTIQLGPNSGDTLAIASAFSSASATSLGVSLAAITSAGDGTTLIGQVDTAMNNLDAIGARIGGFTNQLTNQSNLLSVQISNISDAESSIRNTDIATETANMTRLQLLQQSGISVLSQIGSQSVAMYRLLGLAT